ncbi:MAG: asparagine synthase (glutamine-hydrolyzing) [Bryobacteraceae bacterium]
MCGISGLFQFDRPIDDAAAERASSMVASLRHRGPDGEGFYRDANAVLGHRRLSLIDLTPAGRQPLSNGDGSLWVTFNGEIYNFRELRAELTAARFAFRSQSDTEVLVHGYRHWGGPGLARRLRGMFAFAIWDAVNKTAFLARDPVGIKPLYMARSGGSLAFASEVRALKAAGFGQGSLHPEAIAGFLVFGSVPSPLTHVRGIESLAAGHCLTVAAGSSRTACFWDWEPSGAGPESIAGLLESSVRRHLISDVPVGIFLSGGVDSAAVCALASRVHDNLTAVTVAVDQAASDEGPEARSLAREIGMRHTEVRVSAAEFMDSIPAVMAAMDQPTHDGVNAWVVSRAARQTGLKAVLSGVGGDELFLGYPYHGLLNRHRRVVDLADRLPGFLRRAAVRGATAWGAFSGRENWSRLSTLSHRVTAQGLYLSLRGFFAPAQVAALTGWPEARVKQWALAQLETFATPLRADVGGFNRIEFHRYLQDQLLRDADAFGMAHGLEIRVPFLDQDLVAATLALPARGKFSRGVNKPALTRAVNHPAVTAAGRRPKRGFSFPFAQWMRGNAPELRDMASRVTAVDREQAIALWNQFESGRLHWSRAWALVVLGGRFAR